MQNPQHGFSGGSFVRQVGVGPQDDLAFSIIMHDGLSLRYTLHTEYTSAVGSSI